MKRPMDDSFDDVYLDTAASVQPEWLRKKTGGPLRQRHDGYDDGYMDTSTSTTPLHLQRQYEQRKKHGGGSEKRF